jgi:hypothetical protein
MKCSTFNDWDELEAVLLGSFMDPNIVHEVFDHSYFQPFVKYADRLAKETEEDLNNIQLKLENMGIKVVRPDKELTSKWQLEEAHRLKLNLKADSNDIPQDMFMKGIPIPIGARNDIMVYGDVIYHNGGEYPPCMVPMDQFENKKVDAQALGWGALDWPAVTRVDDLLIFGNEFNHDMIKNVMSHTPHNTKYIQTNINGHVDASLACLRPGLMLTSERNPHEVYEQTFPGWTYVYAGENGFHHMCRQLTGNDNPMSDIIDSIKNYGDGSWYINGMENDPDISQVSDIINSTLGSWFGYSEETYFEINCLTINPNLSMVIGESNDMQEKLKKHGHEVINVEWRNRWFFDQGLHCITQDLIRKK